MHQAEQVEPIFLVELPVNQFVQRLLDPLLVEFTVAPVRGDHAADQYLHVVAGEHFIDPMFAGDVLQRQHGRATHLPILIAQALHQRKRSSSDCLFVGTQSHQGFARPPTYEAIAVFQQLQHLRQLLCLTTNAVQPGSLRPELRVLIVGQRRKPVGRQCFEVGSDNSDCSHALPKRQLRIDRCCAEHIVGVGQPFQQFVLTCAAVFGAGLRECENLRE